MGKEMFGNCKLCGKYKKLTFEHVPPEKAFNSSAVKKFSGDTLIKLLTKNDDYLSQALNDQFGKLQQRGCGDYYLCAACNNNTGSWYMTEYIRFSHMMGYILNDIITNNSSGNLCSVSIEQFYPLRILKGILTMFCDINQNCMNDNNLREFLLDKESVSFDTSKYSISLYLSKGPLWRTYGASTLCFSNGTTCCLSEISTVPVGLILTIDNDSKINIPGLCINDFANFSYNEKATGTLTNIPILEVNSPLPMAF